MTQARISQLSDMLVYHIVFRRYDKALLIAQALRRVTGWHYAFTDKGFSTGYRGKTA